MFLKQDLCRCFNGWLVNQAMDALGIRYKRGQVLTREQVKEILRMIHLIRGRGALRRAGISL